jgi:hypothetical protein
MKVTYSTEMPTRTFKFVIGRLYQHTNNLQLYLCCGIVGHRVDLVCLNDGRPYTSLCTALESLYTACGSDFTCFEGKATIENY